MFYEPEKFNSTEAIELEKSRRLLQPIWDWMITGREDLFRSALFMPLCPLIFYHIVTWLFTFIDLYGQRFAWITSRKLQPNRKITWPMIINAVLNNFWNHVLFIIPLTTFQWIWVPPTPLPPVAPTLWQFTWQLIACIFVFDFQYWLWHVIHHKYRFLYRWCHSIHHQYHATFAMVSNYLHPWELLSISLMVALTPWAFNMHCLTYWTWLIFSVYVSIEVHVGYNLPWGLNNFLPFYGGAPSHDMHHQRPFSNFQPWMNYLDVLFGWNLTAEQLKEMQQRKQSDKEKQKGEVPADFDRGLKYWN